MTTVTTAPTEATSLMPAPVVLNLTPEQAKALEGHFALVRREAHRGFKGMLVAQVFSAEDPTPNKTQHGVAQMKVGFIAHDKAVLLEKSAR